MQTSHCATQRSVVAAALVAPLAAARGALAQEATPAADDVQAIVGSFYEPFNTGDVSGDDTILAEDRIETPLNAGGQPGCEGFKPIIDVFRGVFPDMQLTIEDGFVDGDRAAVRSTVRGTHEGDFLVPAIGIHRIENGRIVETWHIEDWLSVIFQLGAAIQPAAAAATPTG